MKIGLPILAAVIILVLTVGMMITQVSTRISKNKCLNSQNARRWHFGICEEYHNNQWVVIDPFEEVNIYYNDMGQKVQE